MSVAVSPVPRKSSEHGCSWIVSLCCVGAWFNGNTIRLGSSLIHSAWWQTKMSKSMFELVLPVRKRDFQKWKIVHSLYMLIGLPMSRVLKMMA